jgi:hypothetical protein
LRRGQLRTHAKSFKRNSKTEYKAFTQIKQERIIQFYVNIDHISLGKQSIANKYAPINTQNIGFIRENIELNTLYINVLIYFSLNMFSSTKLENRQHSTLREQRIFYNRSQISVNIES